jgi:hypothetical protein
MSEDTNKTVAQTREQTIAQFKRYLADRAVLDTANFGESLADAQLASVLQSQSADDLFAAMELEGLTPVKALPEGTEIQINGFHFAPSMREEFDSGYGAYVVIDAQLLSDGTELTLDTGIPRIIGFLRMIESGQAGIDFPVSVVIHKVGTGTGNELVTFRKLPERAIQGKTAKN